MKIRITKCSSDSYWYRSRVGEVFPVIGEDEENYYVEPPAGWGRTREYGVAIEDAEMVIG